MTQKKSFILPLAATGVFIVAIGGAYWAGMHHALKAPSAPTSGAKVDPGTDKKVLYWHDPMVPGPKFDQPGKSPFMDMQLVPMYADDAGDTGKVSISPRLQQNLGIRTAEVRQGSLAARIEAVGTVAYNERAVAVVQARSNGYVERLHVRALLDPVRKGQALAELYVPDWVAAQEDYLAARHMQGDGIAGLADAARQRMRLVGMSEEQIRLVESTGKVHARLTLTAPIAGVVTELGAREGMTVMSGAPLYRINGLSTVWVNADIPESQAGLVRPGNVVEARAAASPGLTFQGKVGALLPEVHAATRTLTARIELANPSGQLVPGMFATVNLAPAARAAVLLVPSEAVIQTGRRSLVFVAAGEGKFAPVDVETGAEANGQTEVRKGLSPGQKVVVSGQFLVDSEASLKGTVARMAEPPRAEPGSGMASHRGAGRVEKIDADTVTISHGPISSLNWGAMTMPFKLPSGGMPRNVAVGDMVTFDFKQTPDGQYQLTSITPTADAPSPVAKPMDGTPGDRKMGGKGGMQ
jgi:Cu(I)/Ag(I) efflux system membrane fusion protein